MPDETPPAESSSPRANVPQPTPGTPVALITGGSAGLGLVIAEVFLKNGYRVVITGRDQGRLETAAASLGETTSLSDQLAVVSGDVNAQPDSQRVIEFACSTFGRLDVLVNCVGASDRGLIENLQADKLNELFQRNVITALFCSQAAIPMLSQTHGSIVNIGSLGSKVGARYIGGYATAKHALAGMTQQLRLELRDKNIHVGLVNPGPIRRSDENQRYRDAVSDDLPAQASRPGGGTRVKGLPPERVANTVLTCVRKRKPDIVVPSYLRILIAVGHAFPRLGDWLLLKFTS